MKWFRYLIWPTYALQACYFIGFGVMIGYAMSNTSPIRDVAAADKLIAMTPEELSNYPI